MEKNLAIWGNLKNKIIQSEEFIVKESRHCNVSIFNKP